MPNALAHFGIQGVITHALIKDADPKWVAFGCVISDLPWITQRAISVLTPSINAYDLQLYAIVQATFVMSLVLGLATALCTRMPAKIFRILALNSGLHLLLDASQIKWANGVHFFAPFWWKIINFGWFWPESIPAVLLTMGGLIYMSGAFWHRLPSRPPQLRWPSWRRLPVVVCFAAYCLLPIALRHGPYQSDSHFVQTLQNRSHRTGQPVEMDRRPYVPQETSATLSTLTGEALKVTSQPLPHAATVSVKARFTAPDTIHIHALHVHWPWFRDGASYVGLSILLLLWLKAWGQAWFLRPPNRL